MNFHDSPQVITSHCSYYVSVIFPYNDKSKVQFAKLINLPRTFNENFHLHLSTVRLLCTFTYYNHKIDNNSNWSIVLGNLRTFYLEYSKNFLLRRS